MRRPSSTAALLAAVGCLTSAATGCASGGNQPPDPSVTSDRIVTTDANGRVYRTTDSNSGTEVTIHSSSSSVMAALAQIYPDLGIPVGTAITASGQIGNQHYRVPGHRLKGTQLSQIIECGQESVTGSRADIDEVTISVISTIRSQGDSVSSVTTLLTATARPFGTSSDPVHCATNGRFEEMLNGRLQKALLLAR
jgi:hypothetical protein